MDKKDNTIYYAVGAVALAGGAYYAYKKGLFDKILGKKPAPLTSGTSTTSVTSEENKLQAMKNEVETSYTPLTNPNSYQSKVMKIQDDIGARSDGKVGNQTNSMFKAKYGLDKGDITPLNIDYYLNQVNTKDTLAARQAKKEKAAEAIKKAASVATTTKKSVNDFKVAYNNGFRTFGLSLPYSASEFLRDGVSGALKPTGKKVSFGNGDLVLRSGSSISGKPYGSPVFGSASVSISFDGGKTYYAFPPTILLLNK